MKTILLLALGALTTCALPEAAAPNYQSCASPDKFGLYGPTEAACQQWHDQRAADAAFQAQEDQRRQDREEQNRKYEERRWSAKRKRLIFHIKNPPALACVWARALIELSKPLAKERLGEINYTSYISRGGCVQIDNRFPLYIGPSGPLISGAFQIHPGTSFVSKMFFIYNRDLVGFDGLPPHDVPPH